MMYDNVLHIGGVRDLVFGYFGWIVWLVLYQRGCSYLLVDGKGLRGGYT